MNKTLIRGDETPQENYEEITSFEFMNLALEQIASTSLSIKDMDAADPILDAMSDMLELMGEYLKVKNIEPSYFFEHAAQLRNTKGAFNKKFATTQE